MSKRLNFLICGAQKSGTTALYSYLNRHPDIFLPSCKELHIFDNEHRDWSGEGISSIDDDNKHHFSNLKNESLCGEATPVSLFWRSAPERIWRYNHEIKLIAILRNPITRAYSHWNMEIQRGRDKAPFNTSLEKEKNRCSEALPLQHRIFSYLERGFYTEQIRRLWSFFSPEQVLIMRQDDLLRKPAQSLKMVYNFLDIESISFSRYNSSHSRGYDKAISLKDKVALRFLYQREIAELESMLGWDCSSWLEE